MAYPPASPLLLTRRLSSFLHSSLASLQEHKDQQPAGTTLQTALLVTPSGKLLAYESPLPVRTLRTHCSVAASLWTIHASSSPSVAVALDQTAPINPAPPASQTSPPLAPTQPGGGFASPADEAQEAEPYHDGSTPVSIAASFDGGAVFVVRRLHCGLLFACSTPSPSSTASRPATAIDPAASLSVIDAAAAPSSSAAPPQSSLLPQSTLPILPPPPSNAAASPSSLAAHQPAAVSSAASASVSASSSSSPTPINVPSKSLLEATGSSAPAASVKTTATAETFATAPSGTSHGADGEAGGHADAGTHSESGADADREVNADAASTTTTGTTATVGAGGKVGSVAATLAIARRQVDEVARLLDEKLGALSVPEENIGINGFC
ncbi:hypothetical protein SCUCBS95973_000345 [Sporothrix curviconia]|uniref:Uncharacterized protein n=1 Tax=Sporothrix curviconia TaxID=1260050 RepID=A0ABP0APE1_9PEZI